MSAQTTAAGNYFLAKNADFALSANASNITIFGFAGGTSEVDIQSSDTNITVNANVNHVGFSGAISAYNFQEVGNTVKVYLAGTSTLVSTIIVGGGGSLLSFGGAFGSNGFGANAPQALALQVQAGSASTPLQIAFNGQSLSTATNGAPITLPAAPTNISLTPIGGNFEASNTLNSTNTGLTIAASISGAIAGEHVNFYVGGVLVGSGPALLASSTSTSVTLTLSALGSAASAAILAGGPVTAQLVNGSNVSALSADTTLIYDSSYTPPAPPPPPPSSMTLTVAGDSVSLAGTTAASTVTLTGADLVAYPSATYGTVAKLVTAGFGSVTNSGGNFTLDVTGNAHATTFNFGTGAVSGTDAASSAGITYQGVTTFVTGNVADNVTGSASGGNTVNLGALAFTGTVAFGASGSNNLRVSGSSDISGGTISSGGSAVTLVFAGAGTETMSTAQYNLFNATAITGGSFAGNAVTYSNAGTVTGNTNVKTYNLSSAGNTITLNNVANNVNGAASGNDTVNLAALAYTGTVAFGAAGTDVVQVSGSSNISGGSITTGGATVGLVFASAGTETLSTAQYNLFNATSITGGSFVGNTISFSNAGTLTANANVGSYTLSSSGNTITLNNVANNVTGAASGNDTVNLAALTYTGTLAFGAAGSDTVNVTVGGNISGGTITSGGATVALVLSGAGTETLSTAEYNLFNATSITGGTFGGNTVTFSNGGTVTANANVGNYTLSASGNTITLTNVADNVTGAAIGNDTVNLAALAYTGTVAFGAAGTDSIHVTIGGDISGGTITTAGATVGLVLSGAGTETLSTAQYNLFNATSITGGSFVGDTITFSNAGTITANGNVGNYSLSSSGNTITLNNAADNVTGAASGNDTVNLAALTYTGTLAFGAAGTDTVNVTVGGNISGGSVTSGGAAVSLVLSGAGTETLSTAEYNLFNATSITGGTFGGDTITFSNAGTVTANTNIGNYILSTAGNTITLNNVADNVTGAASGNDTVNLAALTYTGTVALGASGTDSIHVTVGGNISSGTITSSGATVSLVLSAAGTETMTTGQYNLFNATSITGGTFGGDTITFSNGGTVTANANVGNYTLSTAGNTINLNNVADHVTGAAFGNDIVNLAALTYTGTVAFGAVGSDSIHVSGSSNISGGTITTSGATVGLVFGAAGTETMTTTEYNLFNAATITGGTFGGNTITFSNAGSVTDNVNVGNYHLASAGDTMTVNDAGDHITGAASGNNSITIASGSFTGSLAFGAAGSNTVQVSGNASIAGGTVSTSGASVGLSLSGAGTETINSAEAAVFHAASSAIVAPSSNTVNISDATTPLNLSAQENALSSIVLLAGSNTVNVSIGAASVNAGAAGFNQLISINGGGNNTFNINNGAATITGAIDSSHYVSLTNYHSASDNIVLTLSGVNQNGNSQSISDSGNDPITAANNGVIYLTNLGALTGYVVGNATDLSSAETNFLAAVDPSTASTGTYTFAVDTLQGAAIYQTHFTGSTLDGIQLVGVVQGDIVFSLVGHVS